MTFPVPLKSGAVVGGHYIIDGLINRGGFGSIYRGIDTTEGNRLCAIKETYDVTPAARRQALMEAGILFTIKSKHLPQVYDAFEEGGRFYLVMQLIEGENLQQLMQARGAPCGESELLAWILPIMQVLQDLHSRNPAVIHRDIKPANIILTVEGYTVLVDFGVTKLYDPADASQTMIKAVTEGFSPPEQYSGTTSPQSDIYALAATMYYLLTAVKPPSAISRSLRDSLVPPRAFNPRISPQLEQALLRGLALRPEDRYRSMREFMASLPGQGGLPGFSGFSGHADPTVMLIPSAGPSAAGRAASQSRGPAIPAGQAGGMPPSLSSAARSRPASPPAGSRPVLSYVMVAPPRPAAPLPSPMGQGCLWGLLEGILAALLVLLLRTQAPSALSLLFAGLGWLACLLAGFMATRRGGRSIRGAWAGLWAAIAGWLSFTTVFLSGAVVLVSLRLARLGQQPATPTSGALVSRAFHEVFPWFSSLQAEGISSSQLLTLLVAGLLLAMLLGWIGGWLGRRRFLRSYAVAQAPPRP
jgi:hypothetical protein